MTTSPIHPDPASRGRPAPTPAPSAPAAAVAARPAGRGVDLVQRLLALAGIRLDGPNPWDLQVRDPRLFERVRRGGLVALGDAYVDGWWDCPRLDEFFTRAFRAELPARLTRHPRVILAYLRDRLWNRQAIRAAARNVRAHYDLGLDLFRRMLDARLTYSCGYWRNAPSLDAAQEAKLDLVCRKLELRPGQRVLDIGCGWGSWVGYAAAHYGVQAVGITLSPDQAAYARQTCADLDVEIRLQDYRAVDERFDAIASIGMFEHVGGKNYRAFMNMAHRCLADDGLFLLHTFASRDSFPNRAHSEVEWIDRHVFPGFQVPSMARIGRALDGKFVVEDVENFGADYDPTLMAWHENFERAWPELRNRYDERFRRLWRYYLLCSAGAFRSRAYQLWQFVLSKQGVPGGYRRPTPAAPSTPPQ